MQHGVAKYSSDTSVLIPEARFRDDDTEIDDDGVVVIVACDDDMFSNDPIISAGTGNPAINCSDSANEL